jgi:hypothetical protein
MGKKDVQSNGVSTEDTTTPVAKAPKDSKTTFKSRYANHTLNFDGVPRIEFTPVSSKDASNGGLFKTDNQRQINALRNCDDSLRGIIKEVK